MELGRIRTKIGEEDIQWDILKSQRQINTHKHKNQPVDPKKSAIPVPTPKHPDLAAAILSKTPVLAPVGPEPEPLDPDKPMHPDLQFPRDADPLLADNPQVLQLRGDHKPQHLHSVAWRERREKIHRVVEE